MKKENPPVTTTRRASKFDAVCNGLVAEPGTWFNITDDVESITPGKGSRYYAELARSINAGTRQAFAPRGAFEARAEDRRIWARAVALTEGDSTQPEQD